MKDTQVLLALLKKNQKSLPLHADIKKKPFQKNGFFLNYELRIMNYEIIFNFSFFILHFFITVASPGLSISGKERYRKAKAGCLSAWDKILFPAGLLP